MSRGIFRRARRKPTDERRLEIANAARRVLALHGARAFTAQGIANNAGLTAVVIYGHFRGMSEIAVGIFIFWDRPFVIGDFVEVGVSSHLTSNGKRVFRPKFRDQT